MKNENRVFVGKGWGYEDWIWNDDKYCGKKLFFLKGKRCSWHYHSVKDETFYVQSGKLVVIYSDKDCLTDALKIHAFHGLGFSMPSVSSELGGHGDYAKAVLLEPGDSFHVSPGMRHQMYALLDTEMFEFSTKHHEEDSIRVLKGD